MAALRRALVESTSAENIQKLGKVLLDMSLNGDVAAARVWLDHIVGRPTQAVELTAPGGGINFEQFASLVLHVLEDFDEAREAVSAAFNALALAKAPPGSAENPLENKPQGEVPPRGLPGLG
jgi:hypothetical protein